MDGVDDEGSRRRRSFKERLGFIGMGCCGATWGFRSASLTVRDGQQEQPHQQQHQLHETDPGQDQNVSGPECMGPTPASSSMNLAAALAAERQLQGPQDEPGDGDEGSRGSVPGTPWRVSLMRLLEETEGGDTTEVEDEKRDRGGAMIGEEERSSFHPRRGDVFKGTVAESRVL